jgi:hypothetical protein
MLEQEPKLVPKLENKMPFIDNGHYHFGTEKHSSDVI